MTHIVHKPRKKSDPGAFQVDGNTLYFFCRSCLWRLSLPLEQAGKEGPCPRCGRSLEAPSPTPEQLAKRRPRKPRPILDTGVPGLLLPEMLTTRMPEERTLPWAREMLVTPSPEDLLLIEAYGPQLSYTEEAEDAFWEAYDCHPEPILAFEPSVWERAEEEAAAASALPEAPEVPILEPATEPVSIPVPVLATPLVLETSPWPSLEPVSVTPPAVLPATFPVPETSLWSGFEPVVLAPVVELPPAPAATLPVLETSPWSGFEPVALAPVVELPPPPAATPPVLETSPWSGFEPVAAAPVVELPPSPAATHPELETSPWAGFELVTVAPIVDLPPPPAATPPVLETSPWSGFEPVAVAPVVESPSPPAATPPVLETSPWSGFEPVAAAPVVESPPPPAATPPVLETSPWSGFEPVAPAPVVALPSAPAATHPELETSPWAGFEPVAAAPVVESPPPPAATPPVLETSPWSGFEPVAPAPVVALPSAPAATHPELETSPWAGFEPVAAAPVVESPPPPAATPPVLETSPWAGFEPAPVPPIVEFPPTPAATPPILETSPWAGFEPVAAAPVVESLPTPGATPPVLETSPWADFEPAASPPIAFPPQAATPPVLATSPWSGFEPVAMARAAVTTADSVWSNAQVVSVPWEALGLPKETPLPAQPVFQESAPVTEYQLPPPLPPLAELAPHGALEAMALEPLWSHLEEIPAAIAPPKPVAVETGWSSLQTTPSSAELASTGAVAETPDPTAAWPNWAEMPLDKGPAASVKPEPVVEIPVPTAPVPLHPVFVPSGTSPFQAPQMVKPEPERMLAAVHPFLVPETTSTLPTAPQLPLDFLTKPVAEPVAAVAPPPPPAVPSSYQMNPFGMLPRGSGQEVVVGTAPPGDSPEASQRRDIRVPSRVDQNPFAQHAAADSAGAAPSSSEKAAVPAMAETFTPAPVKAVAMPKRKNRKKAFFSLGKVAALLMVGGAAYAGYIHQERLLHWWEHGRPGLVARLEKFWKKAPVEQPNEVGLLKNEPWNVYFKLPEHWQWMHAGGQNRIWSASCLANEQCRIVMRAGIVGVFPSTGDRTTQSGVQSAMQRYFARVAGPQPVAVGTQQIGTQSYAVMRLPAAPGAGLFHGENVARVIYQTLRNDAIYAFDFTAAGAQAGELVGQVAAQVLPSVQELVPGASLAGASRRVRVAPEGFGNETGLFLEPPAAGWFPLEDAAPLFPLLETGESWKVAWSRPADPGGQGLVGYRNASGDLYTAGVLLAPTALSPEEEPLAELALQSWFPGAKVSVTKTGEHTLGALHGLEFQGDLQWEEAPRPALLRIYRAGDYVYLLSALAGNKDGSQPGLAEFLRTVRYLAPGTALAAYGDKYTPLACRPLQRDYWAALIRKAEESARKDQARELCQAAWDQLKDASFLLKLVQQQLEAGQTAAALTTLENGWTQASADCDSLAEFAALSSEHGDTAMAVEMLQTALTQDCQGRSPMGIPYTEQVLANLAQRKAPQHALQLVETFYKRHPDPQWKIWEASLLYQSAKTKSKGVELLERWVAGRHTPGLAKQLLDFIKTQDAQALGLETADRVLRYERSSPLAWLLKVVCLREDGQAAAAEKALTDAQEANHKLTGLDAMIAAIAGDDGEAAHPGKESKISSVRLPSAISSLMAKASAKVTPGTGWSYAYRVKSLAADQGGQGRTTYHEAVRIHDAVGMQEFNQIRLKFNPKSERIELHDFKVRGPDGKVKTSPTDIQKAFLADSGDQIHGRQDRLLIVPVPGLALGSTLEYVYTREPLVLAAGELTLRHVFGGEAPTALEIVYLDQPTAQLAHFHSQGHQPKEDGHGIYWLERELPALTASLRPAVLWTGARSATWAQVGADYRSLLQNSLVLDASVRQLAQEKTAQAQTNPERVAALAKFVSESLSYSGLQLGSHALQPYTATQILRNRYGDCKDHSLLLYQLCQAIGISASMALCNVDTDVPETLPSLGAFNHMIVAIPAGDGKWDYIDCTNKRLAYRQGQVPWLLGGRRALLLSNSPTEEARLATIPAVTKPELISIQRTITQTPGASESVSVQEEISCSGLAACAMRGRIGPARESTSPQHLGRIFGLDYTLFPMKNVKVEHLTDLEQPLCIRLNYEVRKGLLKQADSYLVQLPYHVDTKLLDPQEMLAEKFTGAYFEFPLAVATTTHLTPPPGFTMLIDPPPAMEGPFLSRTVERELHSDHLILRTCLTRRVSEIATLQDYEAFQSGLLASWAGLDHLPLATSSPAVSAPVAENSTTPITGLRRN